MVKKADIALIGLAVMGENLVLNMESKGFTVAVYNRTTDKVARFAESRAKGKKIIATYSLQELVASLDRPRKVMMLVKAGSAVDDLIEQLLPLLEQGDIIIDGGNSNYMDTIRRTQYVESKGLLYIGTGVSGGELGALRGPSMMPGGSPAAWAAVKDIFTAAAAKVPDGVCCEWVGANGAGHFVKMVHNGIEYGDMQIICEVYDIMRRIAKMPAGKIAEVFAQWNKGRLSSYLIEITADILAYKHDGKPLIDYILDAAGQKGTGKWTVSAALELGTPLTLIAESVFARTLSSQKDERINASKALPLPAVAFAGDERKLIDDLESALYCAKIISYAQGFSLMRRAAVHYGWDLNFGNIALLWRGGCIIRSAFLDDIKRAFDADASLENLLLDAYFAAQIQDSEAGWRRVCVQAIGNGVPTAALSAALSYLDALRSANLPANLLQAQRDYFGAHTYERTDRPRGEFFHTNWTGEGGDTASSAYVV
ncbi:MAG: decarboxylating NADP(+)-dependent phosphogluconate dehydrogenase [Prevotellaceae bacterium]|jgi:6-phosphogluconate dehydrogenase|nr:decarboxylating NADP(+)-dependent phosphogluconate dehydrogenase [Prevotellaceae bacterium]